MYLSIEKQFVFKKMGAKVPCTFVINLERDAYTECNRNVILCNHSETEVK